MKYLYNDQIYKNEADVDDAIRNDLQNWNAPSEWLQEIWETEVEEIE